MKNDRLMIALIMTFLLATLLSTCNLPTGKIEQAVSSNNDSGGSEPEPDVDNIPLLSDDNPAFVTPEPVVTIVTVEPPDVAKSLVPSPQI